MHSSLIYQNPIRQTNAINAQHSSKASYIDNRMLSVDCLIFVSWISILRDNVKKTSSIDIWTISLVVKASLKMPIHFLYASQKLPTILRLYDKRIILFSFERDPAKGDSSLKPYIAKNEL